MTDQPHATLNQCIVGPETQRWGCGVSICWLRALKRLSQIVAKMHEVAQAGVPVIWVGDKPKRSRGYRDHEARDSSVAELAQDVLGSAIQTSLGELEMALEQTAVVPPLSRVEDGWMRASATVRDTGDGYIVAVCNEYDRALVERIQIHLEYESARWMDPVTGETSKVESDILDLNLEAGRCQVLVTRSN